MYKERDYCRGYVYSIFPAKVYMDNGEVVVDENIFEFLFFPIVWFIYGIICEVKGITPMFPVRIAKKDIEKSKQLNKVQ